MFNPSEHQLSSHPCLEELSSRNLEFSDAPPPPLNPIPFHPLLVSPFILSSFLYPHFYIFLLLLSSLYFTSAFSCSGSLVTLLTLSLLVFVSLYLILAFQGCEFLQKEKRRILVSSPLNTEFWYHSLSVFRKYNKTRQTKTTE